MDVSVSQRIGLLMPIWDPAELFGLDWESLWGATSALVCGRTLRRDRYKRCGVVIWRVLSFLDLLPLCS